MRFLIDNALSPKLAEGLVEAGHDAVHARARDMAAASDAALFELAARESRALVSEDTDFGTLLALRDTTEPSVILFRHMPDRRAAALLSVLLMNLPDLEGALLAGSIVVIRDRHIRIRRLPISS